MGVKIVFEEMSVRKAVFVNAGPAIISMLVTLVYNVADIFFIGQTGDEMQVAAVALVTPVFLLFMALGTLFGVGGTSVISRAFGEGREEFARSVSAFCFWGAVMVGFACIFVFMVCVDDILLWIGAGKNTMVYARAYLLHVTWSAPFVVVSTAFSNIVRAEGKSHAAMCGVLLGTILNIVLDPLLILVFDLGVVGAAWATVVGNIMATLYYIYLLLQGNSHLSISIRDLSVRGKTVGPVFAIGVPASLNSVMMSVSNILLNVCLVRYGDIVVASMGIAMKISMVVVLLQMGLGQGIQPLLGYNFGARCWNRFKETLRFSCRIGIVMGAILSLVCWLASDELVRLFIDSTEIQKYGTRFLRVLLSSGTIMGVLFIYINALQAVGAAKASLLLSISRQGLLFIPLLFLFDFFFQLDGVVMAQPIADILSCFLAIVLFIRVGKKYGI